MNLKKIILGGIFTVAGFTGIAMLPSSREPTTSELSNYRWVTPVLPEPGEGINSVAIRVRSQEPQVKDLGYRVIANEISRLNHLVDNKLPQRPIYVPCYHPSPGLVHTPEKSFNKETQVKARCLVDPSYSSK